MTQLTYRALTPNKQRFRLVRIFPIEVDPGQGEPLDDRLGLVTSDQIRCSIPHVSLHDAPFYQALSYTWGPPIRTSHITANGSGSLVTRNLDAALRRLRSANETVSVWIDDLCINQQDDVEKSQQVGQMREIYTRAAVVWSWLGPAADDSDLAMQWIRKFGQMAHNLNIGSKPELLLRNLLGTPLEQRNALFSEEMRHFLHDFESSWISMGVESGRLVNSISKLLKRPYWSRIWIVQEVFSATKLEYVCGTQGLDDIALHSAIRLIRNYIDYRLVKYGPSNLRFLGTGVDISLPTFNPITLFKIRRAGGPLPLLYLLRSLRKFSASDPRDKVFATLGIARDSQELGLAPNYSQGCADVYTGTAKALLKHGYIDVLSLCNTAPSDIELPSWVPDWSMGSRTKTLQERSLDRRSGSLSTTLQPSFQAWKGSRTSQVGISESAGTLSIPSVHVGNISRLGRKWDPSVPHEWLQGLLELSKISGGSSEAVWRTAVADQAMRSGANSAKPRLSTETVANVDRVMDSLLNADSLAEQMLEAGLGSYSKQMSEIARNRRPFLTDDNRLGIGPAEMKVGDGIFVVLGGSVPYVFRQGPPTDTMVLVGEAYVHGIMDGEAVDGTFNVSTIRLR